MAVQIQLRRGTTAEHTTFTGVIGEITMDTTKNVVVVHNGSVAGGFPLALASGSLVSASGLFVGNNLNLSNGSAYLVNGTSVLSATTLGSNVVNSSLTSVGTLTSLTVSGDLTVDTSTLKVDSTNNYVGIGTASPTNTLTVSGIARFASSAGSTQGVRVYGASGSNQWDIYTNGANLRIGDNTGGGSVVIDQGATIGGNLAVDTNTLYVDATNNRVGIGTASPAVALDVRGDASIGTHDGSNFLNVERYASGLPYAIIRAGSTDQDVGVGMIFQYRNSSGTAVSGLYYDASGNLGLGVTPSAWGSIFNAMQLGSGIGTTFIGGRTDNDNSGFFGVNLFYNGTNWVRIGANYATRYYQAAGTHVWDTSASSTAGSTISFTQAMMLDASGNLGVGTTSPNKAGIGKAISVSNSSYALFEANYNDARAGYLFADTNATYVGEYRAKPLVFTTGDTERARITSGGYFKASNDGTYAGATGANHEFRTTATNTVIEFNNSHASAPYGIYIGFANASPDNNSEYYLRCQDSTTARCYIWSDGDLANHDGVYGTISDERLKQDIVDAGSAWDDLKAVRFRKYRMKTDVEANPDAPAMLGVIAQELEQVMPGLVDEHPEFKEQEVTDEDGNVTTERVQVGTTKTVKSSILLMKAAVALQEAMARIEALEVEVAALKAGA